MSVLDEFNVLLGELIRARFGLDLAPEEDGLIHNLQVL